MTSLRVWEEIQSETDDPADSSDHPLIERRWINTPYKGPERRRRNQDRPPGKPPLASGWKPLVSDILVPQDEPQS